MSAGQRKGEMLIMPWWHGSHAKINRLHGKQFVQMDCISICTLHWWFNYGKNYRVAQKWKAVGGVFGNALLRIANTLLANWKHSVKLFSQIFISVQRLLYSNMKVEEKMSIMAIFAIWGEITILDEKIIIFPYFSVNCEWNEPQKCNHVLDKL